MPEEPDKPPLPSAPIPDPSMAQGTGSQAPTRSDQKPPLWTWPVGCWLALLVPAVPLALSALVTDGLAGLAGVVLLEAMFGGIALALSLLIAAVSWLVRLCRGP